MTGLSSGLLILSVELQKPDSLCADVQLRM
jgi:hypothetical protein